MRYFKLFFISVIVFGILLFCLSILFPSVTYVSRAVNVNTIKEPGTAVLAQLHQLAFNNTSGAALSVRGQSKSSVTDTLILPSQFSADVFEGVALYKAGSDSNTVQVFYKIQVPFYKPWNKFALMLNESKYGPSLDSAVSRISKNF